MERAQFFKRLAAFPEEMRSEPSLKDDQLLERCGKVWPIPGIKKWQWQHKGKMKKEERQENWGTKEPRENGVEEEETETTHSEQSQSGLKCGCSGRH